MLWTNAFVIVGSVLTAIPDERLLCVYVGRFLYGIAAGAFAVYCPCFLSIISPIKINGPLVGLSAVMLVAS